MHAQAGQPKLAIDARYLAGPPTGIARSLYTLLIGLATTDPPKLPIVLLTLPDQPHPIKQLALDDPDLEHIDAGDRFTTLTIDLAPRRMRNQLRLPRALRDAGVRYMFSPDAFLPLAAPGIERIVMIHDLIPITCGHMMRRSLKSKVPGLWRLWLQRQAAAARGVVTVSDHAAGDMQKHLGIAGEKIAAVPNAVVMPTLAPPNTESGQRLGALYVGRRDPYKNLESLVKVWRQVCLHFDQPPLLHIVGPPDRRYANPSTVARSLGIGRFVIDHGQVPHDMLRRLYQSCALLVMPSLYEGFGLPVLEAMSHGLPVVSSNRTSLPEVVGDAGVLADPDDHDQFAQAIINVLDDPDLAARLSTAGLARAATFSPQQQAKCMLDAWRSFGVPI